MRGSLSAWIRKVFLAFTVSHFNKTKVHISDFAVSFFKERSYMYCFVSAIPYETFWRTE